MASRRECDNRHWSTFWSTIHQGTRTRHELMRNRDSGQWMVRSQFWPDNQPLYYSAAVQIPEAVGRHCWYLKSQWTNIGEEGRPMFPPAFPGGFHQMAAAINFQPPEELQADASFARAMCD